MKSFLSSLLAGGARESAPVRDALLSLLTPVQRRFVLDPHRYKLARCSRRSGKTYAVAVYMILTCLENSRMPVLYAGLTRDSAKEAVWSILVEVLEKLAIPHHAAPSSLQISFPNGSKITLFGCDAQNARNRLRGRKFKLVCFDETAFYTALDPLIYAVLPMLADLKGTLCLTSSPGELLQGFFYEADIGKMADRWSHYEWTIYDNPLFLEPSDNPAFKTRADEELDMVATSQFRGDRTLPGFVREWVGKWVSDHTTLCYPCAEHNFHDLYRMPHQEHSIGVSIDAFVSAVVVGRYSEYARTFQIVDSIAYEDMDLDDFAKALGSHIEKWKAAAVLSYSPIYTADIAQELRRRYQLPMGVVEIRDKSFHQKIFANDLKAGSIRMPKKLPLVAEFAKLVKDQDGEEIKGQPNYMANAALALYRRVYQTHLSTFQPPLSDEERHIEQLENSRHVENVPWFERSA